MQGKRMRQAGLALITIGFLVGALVAVLDKDHIPLAWFLPALLVGVAGVVVVQLAIRGEAKDESRREANFQILDESLSRIVKNARTLDDQKTDLDIYDLPDWIDGRFREDIAAFVEARESIAHGWGMQAYAKVMSHFAAAERYLNRVWSTAADGYIDEAHTFCSRSREEFEEALTALEALTGRQGLGSSTVSPSAPGTATSTAAPS